MNKMLMNEIFDQLVCSVCLMLWHYSASLVQSKISMKGVFLSSDVLINLRFTQIVFVVVVDVVDVVVVVTNWFLIVWASLWSCVRSLTCWLLQSVGGCENMMSPAHWSQLLLLVSTANRNLLTFKVKLAQELRTLPCSGLMMASIKEITWSRALTTWTGSGVVVVAEGVGVGADEGGVGAGGEGVGDGGCLQFPVTSLHL